MVNWLQTLGVTLTPYAWATHILICVTIQSLIAAALRLARARQPWWLGAAVAIGYAWSREKTEFEFVLKETAHGSTVGPYWYFGFIPFEWDGASQLQFYAPAIAVLLVAWVAERRSPKNKGAGQD